MCVNHLKEEVSHDTGIYRIRPSVIPPKKAEFPSECDEDTAVNETLCRLMPAPNGRPADQGCPSVDTRKLKRAR